MRKSIASLGAAVVITASIAFSSVGGGFDPSPGVTSAIQISQIVAEPVLNFDVTGGTLSGPLHSRITVYNNGLITASQCGGGSSSAGTANATPLQVVQLRRALIDAGGLKLPDQSITVSDIPLTTVTVFKGGTNAKAHTFSYWVGVEQYGVIAQIISDFAAANPTGCFGSSTE